MIPKYNHPVWSDENNNIRVEYYDFKEDSVNNLKKLLSTEYNSASYLSNEDNLNIYDISECGLNRNYHIWLLKLKKVSCFLMEIPWLLYVEIVKMN